MKRFSFLGGFLALVLAFGSVASEEEGFEGIYVLGDSISDQGDFFYHAHFLLGVGVPRSDHYWEGRFSNGEIWAGILAERLGIQLEASIKREGVVDYSCFFTLDLEGCGTNFADGGARTDYNRAEDDTTKPFPVNFLGQGGFLPAGFFPWTLDSQRSAFALRGTTGPGALYVVLAGANDLSDITVMDALCRGVAPFYSPVPIFCSGRGDPDIAIPVVIGSINNAIAEFVNAGARDILVPNLPNLGVIPMVTSLGPDFSELATELSMRYNAALADMLTDWEGTVNIIPFDLYALLADVVENPAAFGFSNATHACYTGFVAPDDDGEECDSPDEYVFWDIEHPTTAMHAVLAERVLHAVILDILDDLGTQLAGLDIPDPTKQVLSNKLQGAAEKLTDDNAANDNAADTKLADFIEQVDSLSGSKIPSDAAMDLSQRAAQLRALLAA